MTKRIDAHRQAAGVAAAALMALALLAGCSLGPGAGTCRIVGAKSERDPAGFYVVTVLVENSSPSPVDLAGLTFELTTFDAGDRVVAENAPCATSGEIQRYDLDRVRLVVADGESRVVRSHVFMKDGRGRLLSDWPIGPLATRGRPGTPAADVPGYLSR